MTPSVEPASPCPSPMLPAWVSKLQESYSKNVLDPQQPAMVTMSNTRRTGEASMHCLNFQAFLEDDAQQLEFQLAWNDSVLLGDITAEPNAQLCWMMPATSDCFMFKGRFYIVSAPKWVSRRPPRKTPCHTLLSADEYWEEERLKQWKLLSSKSRAVFTWPTRAKIPRSKTESFGCRELALDPADAGMTMVHDIACDNFCLLVYKPSKVEHLNQSPFPFKRTVYIHHENDNTWKTYSANP